MVGLDGSLFVSLTLQQIKRHHMWRHWGPACLIHFHALSSSQKNRLCRSPTRTRNNSRSTAISDTVALLAPDQDRTKQGRRYSHSTPPGTWTTSGTLSRGCSQQAMPFQSFLGHSGHMAEPSWGLSIRKSGSTFVVLRISSCALCREVSRRELFAKIPSLPLALEIILFKSLPEIHDHRWGSEQRPISKLTVLRCLKVLILWQQSTSVILVLIFIPVWQTTSKVHVEDRGQSGWHDSLK